MIIRNATLDDLITLVQIDTQGNPYPWTLAKFVSTLNSNQECWVAEEAEQVVGFLIWQKILDEAEIYLFSVAKVHRRQGIGQQLFDKMLEVCRCSSVHKILLEVRASNLSAQAFYKENNFKLIATRPNYYSLGSGFEDALIMRCLC